MIILISIIVYDEDRNVFRDDGQRGIVAIGFDYDATQGIYFSAHDPWMRKLGYCELYDQIAPHFGYYLDTKRFQFDYDGYEWMLQVWKGEYLWCATGAEMGLYYREPGSTLTDDFYNTIPDEKMIPMEMTLYHNGKYKFKREMEKHGGRPDSSSAICVSRRKSPLKQGLNSPMQKCGTPS